MSVYLIAQLQINDRDEYGKYEAGFMDVFSKYDGEILGLDEAPETLEGDWPYTRIVLIRFASADEAKRWYESPEYQTIAQHRFNSASANIIMMQGLDGLAESTT
jgi:uncharacterized protein (DUF1330 family)